MTGNSDVKGAAASRLSLAQKGTIVVVLFVALAVPLGFKAQLMSFFRSGDTLTAEFAESHGVVADRTKVKYAGLEVGVVTDVATTSTGTALVTMKVEDDARAHLGGDPSAEIVPVTVLGGQYSIQLVPGGSGEVGPSIPLARTRVPVELDKILEALPSDTRLALRGVARKGSAAFEQSGGELGGFIDDAPPIMADASRVFQAALGREHSDDLSVTVTNVHKFAHVLAADDVELARLATDMRRTTAVLATQSKPIAQTVEELPGTLEVTNQGMVGLEKTLDKLTEHAADIRPSIAQLDPLLKRLDPVLTDAVPLLRDLRPVLQDADPLVRDLVPTVQQAQRIVSDLRGPVLERVNGPILTKLENTWHGKNEYKNSGGGVQADNKFYEEIGYMIANLDRSSMTQDAQGSLLNFQAGVGLGSLAGLSLDDALWKLAGQIGVTR